MEQTAMRYVGQGFRAISLFGTSKNGDRFNESHSQIEQLNLTYIPQTNFGVPSFSPGKHRVSCISLF